MLVEVEGDEGGGGGGATFGAFFEGYTAVAVADDFVVFGDCLFGGDDGVEAGGDGGFKEGLVDWVC